MPQMTIEQMIKWFRNFEGNDYELEACDSIIALLKRMQDVELPKTPTWTRVEVRSEFGHERYDRYILESEVDALRQSATAQIAAMKECQCHHGWRGTVPEDGKNITTPCPACGCRSLFIGSGGHLICARVPSDHGDGCLSPDVEGTITKLKAENAKLTELLASMTRKNSQLITQNTSLTEDNAKLAKQAATIDKLTERLRVIKIEHDDLRKTMTDALRLAKGALRVDQSDGHRRIAQTIDAALSAREMDKS